MPITLDKDTSAPSIKLREVGQYVDFHLVRLDWQDELEFGTERPKLNRDGKPRRQLRITGMAIGGTAKVWVDQADLDIQAGEAVVLYVTGGRLGGYIEAKKQAKTVDVGDVFRVKFDREDPSKSGNPLKVWTFQIRKPRPEELPKVAEAEARYLALEQSERIEVDRAEPEAPSDYYQGAPDGSDIPF